MIAESYKRWRHTRGYGVHSPFAFTLIERVVHPRGVRYYGYRDIDDACSASEHHVAEQARFLLRLLSTLRIESVYLPPSAHPAFIIAARCADHRMRVERDRELAGNCQLIGTRCEDISSEALCRHLSTPGNVVCLDKTSHAVADRLFEGLSEGLMFEGRDSLIIIARPHMQKVRYTVRI